MITVKTAYISSETKVSVDEQRELINPLTRLVLHFYERKNQLRFIPKLVVEVVGFRCLQQCRRKAED